MPTRSSPRLLLPPVRPRYGLGTLLLVMLVISVMCGEAYYLVPAVRGNRTDQFPFILFTLIAPVFVATLVSLARACFLRLQARRNRPSAPVIRDFPNVESPP